MAGCFGKPDVEGGFYTSLLFGQLSGWLKKLLQIFETAL